MQGWRVIPTFRLFGQMWILQGQQGSSHLENTGPYLIIFISLIDLTASYCISPSRKTYAMFFSSGILLTVGVDHVVGRKGKFDAGRVDFLFVSLDRL